MATTPKNTDKVLGRECRFAVHIPTRSPDIPDLHLIKEQVTYVNSDGVSYQLPEVRFLKNYQRPFWVTKPARRTHTQKKEWAPLDDLMPYQCTQSDLRSRVAQALEKPWLKDGLRQLSVSPYLYGTDITSTTLIKSEYMKHYPDLRTPYSVAAFDIETDVVNGTEQTLMATLTFKNKVFTAVQADFVSGISHVIDRVAAKMDEYLSEYVTKRNLQCETVICNSEIDVIRAVLNKAHEWRPDFLAIWNMDFDIPKILEGCERANVPPEDIFSDPSVPKAFRQFKYRQGPKKKVTASGKVVPINPAAQWHVVHATSSFFIIDAMCAYKHIRMGAQEEQSYSLDAILKKKLDIQKLKFKAADAYQGIRWHQFMQTQYKIEYIVYNRFDCIAMLELDEQIKDLGFTLPAYSETSDFAIFKSQPKRIADALHYVCLEEGLVIAATGFSDDGEDEEDAAETLSLAGWIVTLAAHNVVENGLQIILEDPNLRTSLRGYVFDSDASAAYPSAITSLNVSKETTKRELISIGSFEKYEFTMQNINLLSGHVNALEYCTTMFKFPNPPDILKDYLAQKAV